MLLSEFATLSIPPLAAIAKFDDPPPANVRPRGDPDEDRIVSRALIPAHDAPRHQHT